MCKLDNGTFSALMKQYERLVYTICFRLVHDPHTAEDLTQETFLTAFAGMDRCDPAYYRQWLARVATNKCKDHLKSGWMRKVESPGDDALPEPIAGTSPDAQSPEETLVADSEATALADMIRGLREPYGSVATLYLLEEKPVAEIARRLGRPEKTVQNQVFRAKVLLRSQIAERRQTQ